MALPACVTQKTISVLPDPSCADKEREREERRGKEETDAFSNMAFCQFLGACQNEMPCTAARLVGEFLGRGWSLRARQVVD